MLCRCLCLVSWKLPWVLFLPHSFTPWELGLTDLSAWQCVWVGLLFHRVLFSLSSISRRMELLVVHQKEMLCLQGLLFHWAPFVSLLQNANTKEKNQTPSEKMPNMGEKTSPSQGAEAARKESAVAAADSPKNKNEQKNQKPVEKIKER